MRALIATSAGAGTALAVAVLAAPASMARTPPAPVVEKVANPTVQMPANPSVEKAANASVQLPANPSVQPNPASPGTQVWVYDANECTAPNGTATSQALTAPIALAPLANMTGGGGTLREGLAAGTYTITLHCGSTLTTTLHVSTTTHHTNSTPTGAAATGDGSAEDHLGIGDAVVGSAFLLGGLAFATASFIRRRRSTPRG